MPYESPDADALKKRMAAHPFRDVLEPLMHRITLVVLANSQQATPVKTGLLRRSETTRVEPGGLRGEVGTNITYAPFVHKRVPFFDEGKDASLGEVAQLLGEVGDTYLASIA